MFIQSCSEPEDLRQMPTQAGNRPRKISVDFEDEVSVRSVKVQFQNPCARARISIWDVDNH